MNILKIKKIILIQIVTLSLVSVTNNYAASCGGASGKTMATPMTISVDPKVPAPVVAKVVWTKGTVKVIGPDNKERILKANDPINLNDTIVTSDKSQAQIIYSDYTTMTFQEKTKLFVNKYEYHPEVKQGSVGKSVMNLIEGGYRTVTGNIAKENPSDYQVDTDVGVMGVRGTDYSASFAACKLLVKRNSGTPIVHNDKGTIVLTEKTPYVSVPAFDKAPVILKKEPDVFKVPLKIVPATFNVTKAELPTLQELKTGVKVGGGGGGGGGKACAPAGPTSDFTFYNLK